MGTDHLEGVSVRRLIGRSCTLSLNHQGRCSRAGVAQHNQGDPEAALQAFMSASADALSAAGVTEVSLNAPAAALRRDSSGCTAEASAGAQSSGSNGTPAKAATLLNVPGRETLQPATASASVRTDTMAPVLPSNAQGTEAISSSGAAPDSVVAERTAVRALMAQASVLKQLGRLQEALHALKMAEVFDSGVEVHRRQLQAELLGQSEPGRGSNSDL